MRSRAASADQFRKAIGINLIGTFNTISYALLAQSIIERNPMLNGETLRLDGAIRMAPR